MAVLTVVMGVCLLMSRKTIRILYRAKVNVKVAAAPEVAIDEEIQPLTRTGATEKGDPSLAQKRGLGFKLLDYFRSRVPGSLLRSHCCKKNSEERYLE